MSDNWIRTGPRPFWYARCGLGLLGLVAGPAGVVIGFGTGILLDHLISRYRFLASIRRTVHEGDPEAEVELYTVIALYFRERYPDDTDSSNTDEHEILRRYLERSLQTVFSGDARSFHVSVMDALSEVPTDALWAALLAAGPPERCDMHGELLRGQSSLEGDQTRKIWDERYSTVLGLTSAAGEQDIRLAFRRLALQCHPDILQETEKGQGPYSFAEIRTAYETLLSRFAAAPEVPDSEDDHTDPHTHAQSDTRC